MTKRFSSLFVATALLAAADSQAQSTSPSTFNATGGGKEVAGNFYDYSIGEMVLVNTASSPNLTVTQGLLQPLGSPVGIAKLRLPEGALHVYPNPSEDIVYVQPKLNGSGVLELTLFDISGRHLKQNSVGLQNGNEKQSINLSSLASGTYLLKVAFTQDGQTMFHDFKIQKIH